MGGGTPELSYPVPSGPQVYRYAELWPLQGSHLGLSEGLSGLGRPEKGLLKGSEGLHTGLELSGWGPYLT